MEKLKHKKIVVLGKSIKTIRPLLVALWEYGVETFLTVDSDDVLSLVGMNKPDFVLLAYDHPNYSQIIALKRIIQEKYKSTVIGYIEENTTASLVRLSQSQLKYTVHPPINITSISRIMNKIIDENPKKFARNTIQAMETQSNPHLKEKKENKEESLSQTEKDFLNFGDCVQESLDQCCAIGEDDERIKNLVNVNKFYCFPVTSSTFNGYLVCAKEKKEVGDDQFWKSIIELAHYFLINKGYTVNIDKSIEISMESFDFMSWILADSLFTKTAYQNSQEVVVAFNPSDTPIPVIKPSKEEGFFKSSISAFRKGVPVNFNVYLNLEKNKKNVPLLKKGGFITSYQVEKVKKNGKGIVLIKIEDKKKFRNYYIESFFKNRIEKHIYFNMNKDIKKYLNLKEERARMRDELLVAKDVQEFVFPENHHISEKIEIRGSYSRASECGGDWWHYSIHGDKAFLWIGDATGHGVSAAFVTSAAKSASAVLKEFPELPIPQIMSMLNSAVFGAGGGEVLMTFFLASLDLKTGELKYSNASHNVPYLFSNDKGEFNKKDLKLLEGHCENRLGEQSDAHYSESTTYLTPGDRLVFFTDGVVELENEEGRMWGERKFMQSITRSFSSYSGITAPMNILSRSIDDFRKRKVFVDDITYFMVQYKPAARRVKAG